MTLDEINALDAAQFVERIGWVYEHSPWVAERAAEDRPFQSFDHLCDAMNARVQGATPEEQRALLCAHPDLGTRARVSPSSAKEQAGAGLDRLTQEEYDRLLRLNNAWKEKFGFPFLYAVKGSDKFAIMEAMQRRLHSSPEEEFEEALRQVLRIARYRLEEIVP
jgi:2-oxo-4-hydroxy-4-carboxy-5-ureidoimidazoline decarboxylase